MLGKILGTVAALPVRVANLPFAVIDGISGAAKPVASAPLDAAAEAIQREFGKLDAPRARW